MEAEEIVAGVATFNSLINACAKANQIDRAEKWLLGLRSRGIEPDGVSYSTVIHACALAPDAGRAESWFEAMRSDKSVPLDDQTYPFCYNTVVQAMARQGNPDRAEHWMMSARKAGVEIKDASCTILANSFRRAGRTSEATFWSSQIEAQGFAQVQ